MQTDGRILSCLPCKETEDLYKNFSQVVISA